MSKRCDKFKKNENGNWKKKDGHKYLKPCPECDSFGVSTIIENEEIDGIIFSRKYLYCEVCEWKKELKTRCENTKIGI